MISYLWLGFELELYHPREYRMVLWYLDYLLGVLINNHKMVAQYVLEDETYRTKRTFRACPYAARERTRAVQAHARTCKNTRARGTRVTHAHAPLPCRLELIPPRRIDLSPPRRIDLSLDLSPPRRI